MHMAALTVLILGVWAIIYHSEAQNLPKILERSSSHYNSISEDLTIFEYGKFEVTKPIKVEKIEFYAPEPLLVVSPKFQWRYVIVDIIFLFFFLTQLFSIIYFPSQEDEIEMAASIANWLPTNLQDVLQTRVNEGADGTIYKLAISGHSRGGKSAFTLALGFSKTKLSVKISSLIGIDPVAGSSKNDRTQPYVLTYVPSSFNLSIPVTIIGTGFGNQSNFFLQPCAPNLVNYQQFFDECKEGSHFVITDYGHMKMLNDFVYDPVASAVSLVCKSGSGLKSTMRRTLGGIMVAFLDAYFGDEKGQYLAILANPSLAPTNLYVQNKGNFRLPGNYDPV
ncbi:chlorophyllase type 0-like [Chenopodium quinoa]|uniref:chlorophyllase type 0-like n=1 Tax=Chenopodium quinoa TaxID=63459 RepID=UPI000B79A857|nr:chlorophyllase type 0-like [Chenopodium quinoa]